MSITNINLRNTLWRKKWRSQEKRLVIRSFIVKNKETVRTETCCERLELSVVTV